MCNKSNKFPAWQYVYEGCPLQQLCNLPLHNVIDAKSVFRLRLHRYQGHQSCIRHANYSVIHDYLGISLCTGKTRKFHIFTKDSIVINVFDFSITCDIYTDRDYFIQHPFQIKFYWINNHHVNLAWLRLALHSLIEYFVTGCEWLLLSTDNHTNENYFMGICEWHIG